MLAFDLLNQYIRTHPYGISDSAAAQLRYTWKSYLRSCGTDGLDALDPDRVNTWLDDLRQTRRPDTVRTQRGNLITIWWWAYRERLVEEPPLRVRRLRPIDRNPTAWTLEEIRTLMCAADGKSPWWGSLVRTGYDTALRLGNLLRLKPEQVGELVRIDRSKTGRSLTVRLRPETLAAVQRHLAGQVASSVVWPLWGRREAFYRAFRRLVASAGIRPGTFRWLRRSAITQLERVDPGRGTQLAGHAARSTTEQWYLDRSQLTAPPLPPL